MKNTKQWKVKVAGGGLLSYVAISDSYLFSAQDHQFTTDFRILELQRSHIILGVNWFK
jgi:hypothetical protein